MSTGFTMSPSKWTSRTVSSGSTCLDDDVEFLCDAVDGLDVRDVVDADGHAARTATG
jgi:hypothetical protein